MIRTYYNFCFRSQSNKIINLRNFRNLASIRGDSAVKPNIVGLVGFCEDRNSSYKLGSAGAPEKILNALHHRSSNTWSELGCDVLNSIFSYGEVASPDPSFLSMVDAIRPVLTNIIVKKQYTPVILGGDHSITRATCKVISSIAGPLKIVNFDAHPNLYDYFEGNANSHACTIARICEDASVCATMMTLGVRSFNAHHMEQKERFGVHFIAAHEFPSRGGDIANQLKQWIQPTDNVYVTFDLGVLDPAFAPGVSHVEPGGISTRQAIDAIHAIPGRIVGADIVEYNPQRDMQSLTAMTAAKILKEIAGKIMTHASSVGEKG